MQSLPVDGGILSFFIVIEQSACGFFLRLTQFSDLRTSKPAWVLSQRLLAIFIQCSSASSVDSKGLAAVVFLSTGSPVFSGIWRAQRGETLCNARLGHPFSLASGMRSTKMFLTTLDWVTCFLWYLARTARRNTLQLETGSPVFPGIWHAQHEEIFDNNSSPTTAAQQQQPL